MKNNIHVNRHQMFEVKTVFFDHFIAFTKTYLTIFR